MQTSAIQEALLATAGIQSVESVEAYELALGGVLVTARLGFGPSTPNGEVVALLEVARTEIRALAPEVTAIVLEPVVAGPRGDANPPTDVFVIRGAN
jgi:hypothetical protein